MENKNSAKYITEMFSGKHKKDMDAQYEPQRNVHNYWQSDEKAES